MTQTREAFFAAVRAFAPNSEISTEDFRMLDSVARRWKLPQATPESGLRVNAKGLALMREFEGCKLNAYPDPGSADGDPWTIGWGSTGPGIHKGVTWTQAQADERHEADVAKFAAGVERLLDGVPTTEDQFSAMVALAYNIGLSAFGSSTVLRKHKALDHEGAAAAFGLWIKNAGKVMNGLVRRRKAEAALYLGGEA